MHRSDDRFLDKLDLVRPVPREISDRVLELWRDYQTELAKHGITDYAGHLDLEIWQAMGMAPGADTLPEERIHEPSLTQDRDRRACHAGTYERPTRWSWLSSASPTGA